MLSLIISKVGFFSFTFINKILTFISIIIIKKNFKKKRKHWQKLYKLLRVASSGWIMVKFFFLFNFCYAFQISNRMHG